MRRLIEVYVSGKHRGSRCTIPRTQSNSGLYARMGLLWNWRACWVGVHHSKEAKRTCVNLVPFLTIWYTRPGGILP